MTTINFFRENGGGTEQVSRGADRSAKVRALAVCVACMCGALAVAYDLFVRVAP